MRLDKFLAHHLGISRTLVTKALRSKMVRVDDVVVKSGSLQLSLQNVVKYQGQLIEPVTEKRYFMLNKPRGYVCANEDDDNPTILYFIDEPMSDKLHAAGRLDKDTSGLVLITDDGQWSHRITSPKYHCDKIYFVTVSEPLTETLIDSFSKGIQLHNEKALTKPAKLELIDHLHAKVTLSEGRYHQVKRMFAALGHHVEALHREAIGPIALDIAEGEYRPLTPAEIAHF